MAEARAGSEAELLATLEARLERAAAATERLLADAAVAAGVQGAAASADPNGRAGEDPHDRAAPDDSARVPPSGWQTREADEDRTWASPGDADLLLTLLGLVRDRIPTDLQRRLAAALQELLLAVRALLDWCAERLERRRDAPGPAIQDIPIL